MHHKLGHYTFIGGVLTAIIAGLLQTKGTFFALGLLLLGIIVGFLNLPIKDATGFLVASIGLLVAGSVDYQLLNVMFDPLGTVLTEMFGFIKIFVGPSTLIVGIKSIIHLADT